MFIMTSEFIEGYEFDRDGTAVANGFNATGWTDQDWAQAIQVRPYPHAL